MIITNTPSFAATLKVIATANQYAQLQKACSEYKGDTFPHGMELDDLMVLGHSDLGSIKGIGAVLQDVVSKTQSAYEIHIAEFDSSFEEEKIMEDAAEHEITMQQNDIERIARDMGEESDLPIAALDPKDPPWNEEQEEVTLEQAYGVGYFIITACAKNANTLFFKGIKDGESKWTALKDDAHTIMHRGALKEHLARMVKECKASENPHAAGIVYKVTYVEDMIEEYTDTSTQVTNISSCVYMVLKGKTYNKANRDTYHVYVKGYGFKLGRID